MLKYPIFPLTGKTDVKIETANYTIRMLSREPVTVETEEKLFAILYLIRQRKTNLIPLLSGTGRIINDAYLIEFKMRDLADAIGTNDYPSIEKELKNLQNISISFDKKKLYSFVTSPILAYDYDKDTGIVTIKMEKLFVSLCFRRNLILNFELYKKLSKTAKNMYKFFMANIQTTTFTIEMVKQRCHIETTSNKNTYIKVKKALKELQESGFISQFEIKQGKIHLTHNRPPKDTETALSCIEDNLSSDISEIFNS